MPLTTLASETTSSGSYALHVNPATLGLPTGAVANMQIVASSAKGADTYSFARQVVADYAGRPVLAALFGKPRMASQTVNLKLTGARHSISICPKNDVPWQLVYKGNLGEKRVIVGALYSRVRGITAEFTYQNGQNSSLGMGISASTKYANFSAVGTNAISSTASVVFPKFHGHTAHLYKTEFRYGKYRWRCFTPIGTEVWGHWQVEANDFGGGASSPKLHNSPHATYCTTWEAHSTFIKDTSAAYEFKKGVSISDVIGIDLSAQTGYDHNAQVSYEVGNKGRQICGLHGPPAGNSPAPRLIVAGAP